MKHYFILTAVSLAFVLPGYTQHRHAPFANRHLSNLRSHTAVNVNLLPGKCYEINLGSASKTWKNFYLAGNVYKGVDRFLYSDTSGNAFFGILAGRINVGTGNTAVGDSAMYNNTTGSENTAIGYQALYSNTDGFGNSGLSRGNLFSNTTGYFNVASGWAALYNNTEGYANVAKGALTLVANTTGSENTAIGSYALGNNTTNSFNTAVGSDAAGISYDFSKATFLGAHTNSDSGLVNITVVGYEAYATESNQVTVGNSSVTSIGGYANWSNFSDGRYKKNVQEDVPGLTFITQLRPVTYTLDVDGLENKKGSHIQRTNGISLPGLNGKISFAANALKRAEILQSSLEMKARQEKAKVVYTGFIAQEVEQAAKKLNYNFSGVDAPKSEKSFYALRYSDFVVPLVKAVQEQQKQIDGQQKQIEELKALVLSLTTQAVPNTTNLSSAFLKQNFPNPFNKSTVISYHIPDNASHAQILVTDMQGRLIKTFIAAKGEGQIEIGNGVLPAATYNYTLFVNGKKIDTKQMVTTK